MSGGKGAGEGLADRIQQRIIQAMRDGNHAERDILRVALGEIQTAAARGAAPLEDRAAEQLIRKLVKSNRETIEASSDDAVVAKLSAEIEILDSLLPQTLGVEQIIEALAPVADAVAAAGNDGQATGVAMKHLKGGGATVTGADVAAAVKRMRS